MKTIEHKGCHLFGISGLFPKVFERLFPLLFSLVFNALDFKHCFSTLSITFHGKYTISFLNVFCLLPFYSNS